MNMTEQECRDLYLKALKKTYGKVPFESQTVEVGSLLDFTREVIKAQEETNEKSETALEGKVV